MSGPFTFILKPDEARLTKRLVSINRRVTIREIAQRKTSGLKYQRMRNLLIRLVEMGLVDRETTFTTEGKHTFPTVSWKATATARELFAQGKETNPT